jgi:hypothetical protein
MSYGTSETFRYSKENMVAALRETGVLDPGIRILLEGRKEEFAKFCAGLFGVTVGADFMLGSDGDRVYLVMATDSGAAVKSLLVLKFTRDTDPTKANVIPYFLTSDLNAKLKEYEAAPLFKAFDQAFLPDLLLAAFDASSGARH